MLMWKTLTGTLPSITVSGAMGMSGLLGLSGKYFHFAKYSFSEGADGSG